MKNVKIILLIFLLTLSSCTTSPSEEPLKTYENELHGFKFSYPGNWYLEQSEGLLNPDDLRSGIFNIRLSGANENDSFDMIIDISKRPSFINYHDPFETPVRIGEEEFSYEKYQSYFTPSPYSIGGLKTYQRMSKPEQLAEDRKCIFPCSDGYKLELSTRRDIKKDDYYLIFAFASTTFRDQPITLEDTPFLEIVKSFEFIE